MSASAPALPATAGVRKRDPGPGPIEASTAVGPSCCRVTFDHPPINTITATAVEGLAERVGLIEQDPDLDVVFDSGGSSLEERSNAIDI